MRGLAELERRLTEALGPLSPRRQLAFLAGLATRWLPAYEAFAEREEWGDPEALREALRIGWAAVGGDDVPRKRASALAARIHDGTPHMDDFHDAEGALIACINCGELLRAAVEGGSPLRRGVFAAVGLFEGLAEGGLDDPEEESALLATEPGRAECAAQLALARVVSEGPEPGPDSMAGLRDRTLEHRIRPAPPAARPVPRGPTNEELFERYRAVVGRDLQQPYDWPDDPDGLLYATMLISEWSKRYGRRRQILVGEYGRMRDETGRQAVLARNRALDAACSEEPGWDPEIPEGLNMSFRYTPGRGGDARTFDAPHCFGPSMRRLWIEGDGPDGAARVVAWAARRPAAWDRPSERSSGDGGSPLERLRPESVAWESAGDALEPWAAEREGAKLRIRINDYPDEPLYGLVVDGEHAGDFHDWPETWTRPGVGTEG